MKHGGKSAASDGRQRAEQEGRPGRLTDELVGRVAAVMNCAQNGTGSGSGVEPEEQKVEKGVVDRQRGP